MNDLTTTATRLPSTIEDLSKFVLVGREKLVSVRAEIRAIDKLQLAQEVRDQKRDEARMLSEALLDAEVRLGELFKQMPKAQGARTDREPNDSGVAKFNQPRCSGATKLETKEQAAERLGFEKTQVHRFETLADHPEAVEQVKAEARENDDLPTRTAVLNLVKYKEEKAKAEYRQIDEDGRLAQMLSKVVGAIEQLPTDPESVKAMRRGLAFAVDDMATDIGSAISILTRIQHFFRKEQ